MRRITTIDISGSDVGFGYFRGVKGQLGSVLGNSSDTSKRSREFSIELYDLSGASYRMLGVRWSLAVHSDG